MRYNSYIGNSPNKLKTRQNAAAKMEENKTAWNRKLKTIPAMHNELVYETMRSRVE